MSEVIALSAETRNETGKGVARTLRREGQIPAIIYGGKDAEICIATNLRDFSREYEKGHFTSKLIDLTVDGKVIRVIAKEVQVDPVTDKPLHADFMRLVKGSQVRVFVPVKFLNADKSPGLKRGGVLNVVRRDIELLCDSDVIPQQIIVDLNDLQIGDTVHVSHVSIPKGATPTITDRDFTIATIVGRSASTSEDETGAPTAAAEGAAAPAAAAPAAAKAPAAAPKGKK
jgi:large subunit ribosomal protein L25